MSQLTAVSPLDGRYRSKVEKLSEYFSEHALIKYRVTVEITYIEWLSETVTHKPLSSNQKQRLHRVLDSYSLQDSLRIKEIEDRIHHDVKAVEYFLQEKLPNDVMLHPYIHFGLTSEDVNNLAYSLMIKNALHEQLIPPLKKLLSVTASKALAWKSIPMLARTHGQAAIPTTVGKEIFNFVWRLHQELITLQNIQIEAKLNGAVGNYSAMIATYPSIDWLNVTDNFIQSLGLTPHHFTTQILPADRYIKIFQSLHLINSILIGMNQDIWRYISDSYFIQHHTEQEVGSSTMPQKVNPIDFENSEGNCGMANALLSFFIDKLPISRLQRDLTDSTVKRNIGSAFCYCLLSYNSYMKGIEKIQPNKDLLHEVLTDHWEIITEGIQTILRTTGDSKAYDKLKQFSRGKQLSAENITQFINELAVSSEIKQQLIQLSPFNYIGLASQLVDQGLSEMNQEVQ